MKFLRILLLTLTTFLLLSNIGNASENRLLAQQRDTFQKAKIALEKNKISHFMALKKQLKDYPLKSYLDYLYLRKNISNVSESTISTFLKNNGSSFYSQKLRTVWLYHLAEAKKWSSFLDYYQPPQTTSLQCHKLSALINTGHYQDASTEIASLWMVNKSQHRSCDSVFKYWAKKGFPTNDMRWQRIELALKNTKFNLAHYLAKPLNEQYQAKQWISHWQNMQRDPLSELQRIGAGKMLPHSSNKQLERELIHYGIGRLARKSTDKAFDVWQNIAKRYTFTTQQRHQIHATIGQRAALNRQDRALEFYGAATNEPWRVRAALWQQNWPVAEKAIRSLDNEQQQINRWQYWLGRSLAKQGKKKQANEIFQSLVHDRDYYSFLAADLLGQDYRMNNNPINADPAELKQFSQRDAVRRLREFHTLNMSLQARQQAYYLKQRLPNKDLQLLATLTHQWNWHNQTISLLGKAQYWDDLPLRFPVVYDDLMIKASQQYRIDSSWLLGVARQESAFNSRARSHAGALGLMQLMPATGRSTAKLVGSPLRQLTDLYNPATNITLGSAYLRKVYDEHQQNPVLATASYNAGPHRVARWLPKKSLPADIWIENIPFNETRKYTSNVLSYAAIFDYQRQKKILPISKRMPLVRAK